MVQQKGRKAYTGILNEAYTFFTVSPDELGRRQEEGDQEDDNERNLVSLSL
jgi:hypothetical protein